MGYYLCLALGGLVGLTVGVLMAAAKEKKCTHTGNENKEDIHMTFKSKVIQALQEKRDQGIVIIPIADAIKIVRSIDEEEKDGLCAAPNYEELFNEAKEEMMRLNDEAERCREAIRCLKSKNEYLTGFREGVELMKERHDRNG